MPRIGKPRCRATANNASSKRSRSRLGGLNSGDGSAPYHAGSRSSPPVSIRPSTPSNARPANDGPINGVRITGSPPATNKAWTYAALTPVRSAPSQALTTPLTAIRGRLTESPNQGTGGSADPRTCLGPPEFQAAAPRRYRSTPYRFRVHSQL